MVEWKSLTPEQRNALVAEKVMGWQPKECDGEIGEQPISPDGWFCQKCGVSGSWGDDYTHEERPRPYSQYMGIAWLVVEKMVARMGYQHIGFEWSGPLYKPEHDYFSSSQHSERNMTWHFDYTKKGGFPLGCPCWYVKLSHLGNYWWFLADTPQEAICLAALAVCEVPDA